MQLTITGVALPGRSCPPYDDVRIGVQGGKDVEQLHPADAAQVRWELALSAKGDSDVRGPHVQGRPGARFVYLVWVGRSDAAAEGMFRRLKLPLDPGSEPLRSALLADSACAMQVDLTGRDGTPRCGGLRPVDLAWPLEAPKTTRA